MKQVPVFKYMSVSNVRNRIGGIIFSVLASGAEDRGSEPK